MKNIAFTLSLLSLIATSCTESTNDVSFSDLSEHNMKIIPANPNQNDEIRLVVFDDCTYNILSGVKRNGKIIDIRKQFNSMMKMPCMQQNDTILIGRLPEGTCRVNYKLVDMSTYVTDTISISFSFNLPVSK